MQSWYAEISFVQRSRATPKAGELLPRKTTRFQGVGMVVVREGEVRPRGRTGGCNGVADLK